MAAKYALFIFAFLSFPILAEHAPQGNAVRGRAAADANMEGIYEVEGQANGHRYSVEGLQVYRSNVSAKDKEVFIQCPVDNASSKSSSAIGFVVKTGKDGKKIFRPLKLSSVEGELKVTEDSNLPVTEYGNGVISVENQGRNGKETMRYKKVGAVSPLKMSEK